MAEPIVRPEREEIDRKALQERADRFRWHHRERYLAALAKLSEAGRDVVASLPALFHFNHAALPGYVPETPCGLPGYAPDNIAAAALRRIAPGARTRSVRAATQLQSVFLMGSGGSAGHTGNSDIDLWVCCDADLHDALRPKLLEVSQWALGLGVEVQGFLVDAAFFADPADETHNPMLLDEFYRSGIWLAGLEPMWWYVDGAPADRYYQTAEQLRHYRFIPEVIDFGPVGRPSRKALAAAARREVSAALSTPSKSLLKLALVECYFDAPDAPLLSHRYQQLIFAGESDAAKLDTYTLLYEHLEDCGAGSIGIDSARALFLRRILPRARRFASHGRLLQRFHEWGYSDNELEQIRHPERMSLRRTLKEYDGIVELIATGADIAGRIDAEGDVKDHIGLLQIERKPMRAMHPALRADIEPRVRLNLENRRWCLVENNDLLMKSSNYAEPLVWLWLQKFTRMRLRMQTPWFQRAAHRLLTALDDAACVMLLNPFPNPADDLVLLSARDDPLSYGGLQANLLRQLIVVEQNGREASVQPANDPQAALIALREAALSEQAVAMCAADIDDMRLVRRMGALLEECRSAFAQSRPVDIAFGRGRARLNPAGFSRPVEFTP